MLKNEKNVLVRLLLDSKKSWWMLIIICLSSLLSGVLQYLSTEKFGEIVDTSLEGYYQLLIRPIVIILVLLLFESIRLILHYTFVASAMESIFNNIRKRVFKSLYNCKVSAMDNQLKQGDIVQRLNSDIESLCEIASGNMTWFVNIILHALIAFLGCVLLSWQFTLLYFSTFPIFIILFNKINKGVKKLVKKELYYKNNTINYAMNILTNLGTVKAFNLEDETLTKYKDLTDKYRDSSIKVEKTQSYSFAINYIYNFFQYALLVMLSLILSLEGLISVGDIIAITILIRKIRNLSDFYSMIIEVMRRATVICERIFYIIDIDQEEDEVISVTEYIKNELALEVNNLKFKYGNNVVLDNIYFKINEGEKISIIGQSGSGKSTLMKILCDFYENFEGEIFLYGTSYKKLSVEDIRKNLAIVTQNIYLFKGTIYDNIKCANESIKETEVIELLKKVNLWEYVEALDKKIYASIDEFGKNMSVGQKQRLALCRALAKNSKIIILDEPTASLDEESTQQVVDTIEKVLMDKTIILITHKANTYRFINKIYKLNKNLLTEVI